MHHNTLNSLTKKYGEAYKENPDEVKQTLIMVENLTPEEVIEFAEYLAKKTPDEPGKTPDKKAEEPKEETGPYRSYDIHKGMWIFMDGKREFNRQGKPVKLGARMTPEEVQYFNDARATLDPNTLTELIVPAGK